MAEIKNVKVGLIQMSCTGKKQVCINIKADLRLCEAVFQTCVATCNSEGNAPSEWDDCWSQSDK